jgi:hypothetical protein
MKTELVELIGDQMCSDSDLNRAYGGSLYTHSNRALETYKAEFEGYELGRYKHLSDHYTIGVRITIPGFTSEDYNSSENLNKKIN